MFRISLKNLLSVAKSQSPLHLSSVRLINSCRSCIYPNILCVNLSARSNGHKQNAKCYLIPFQPSRCLNKKVSQNKLDQGSKKYLWYLVISTFIVGACMLSTVGYSKVRRRLKGIENVTDENTRKMKHFFRYKGVVLPQFTENIVHKFENFEVRPDDVWVVSFPRSGTTWTQEIVYLINSNMDIEKAKTVSIDDRFPYLEYLTPGLDAIANLPSPRLIKTHLPLKLLPKDINKAKVIYVARNPKDTAVSYYHFCKLLKTFSGEFDFFLKLFVNHKVGYAPWWQHVLDFWNIKDDPNVLFITYEDMCEDMEGNIRKIAEFLGKNLSDKDVKFIEHHCSFDNMKNNAQVNYEWMRHLGVWDNKDKDNSHIRKGKIGEWRLYFNKETNYQINRMVAHKLNASGLTFKYDKDGAETTDQGDDSHKQTAKDST